MVNRGLPGPTPNTSREILGAGNTLGTFCAERANPLLLHPANKNAKYPPSGSPFNDCRRPSQSGGMPRVEISAAGGTKTMEIGGSWVLLVLKTKLTNGQKYWSGRQTRWQAAGQKLNESMRCGHFPPDAKKEAEQRRGGNSSWQSDTSKIGAVIFAPVPWVFESWTFRHQQALGFTSFGVHPITATKHFSRQGSRFA